MTFNQQTGGADTNSKPKKREVKVFGARFVGTSKECHDSQLFKSGLIQNKVYKTAKEINEDRRQTLSKSRVPGGGYLNEKL